MDLQTSYDRVAAEYARRIGDELQHKPLDREWLDRFAAAVRGLGPVGDLGCGPGHVARYLCDRGLPAFGLDLSPGMLAEARRLHPSIEFIQGDMLALDAADAGWGGIAAFYAIVHFTPAELAQSLDEMHRVLRPGGLLFLAFHLGDEALHVDELWELPVNLDFVLWPRAAVEAALMAAGFGVEAAVERDPYPEVEYQSRRAYILARKPAL